MRPAAPYLAILLATAASPSVAAEGGPIRTGEHSGYSRVVLEIETTTEWSLVLAPGSATLLFPGRMLDFGTNGIWDRMPKTRVAGITSSRGETGTVVKLDLACDCRVSTTFVNGRHLALDVHDEAPAGDRAADSATASGGNHAAAIAAAERLLVGQLERAAGQGLIELAQPSSSGQGRNTHAADLVAARSSGPDADTGTAAPDGAEPAAETAPADDADAQRLAHLVRDLAGQRQIAATTVFDRDNPALRGSRQPDPACRPEEHFDLGRWSDGRPVPDQIAGLRRILVGEFDRPNPDAIRDLARLHVRYGLGTEATAILDGFEVPLPDRDLLADLAALVEGRPARGPLAEDIACPGRHGLWLALAGRPAMLAAKDLFPSLRAAFEELPLDLRAMLGPDLVTVFFEAEHLAEARILHDVAIRAGIRPNAALQLAAGRLAAAEARLSEAQTTFAGLVESGASNAAEALLALVRTRLATGDGVPEAWITDLRALAVEHRRGPREPEARLLTAEALARNGDLRGAFAGLAALATEGSARTKAAAKALAPRLLAESDLDRAGRAAFAESVLDHGALITPAPENDGHRTAIAAKLLDLGLANAALDILAPAEPRPSEAATLLAARAHVALGEGAAALARLEDLPGLEAASLRARAQAMQGDFTAAAASSAEAGAEEAVLAYAWAGGDWDRASGSPDPAKAAMAGYMRDRDSGLAAPTAPLTPEDAFAARPVVPSEPSLAAARTLVESGREVKVFVESLLARAE